jgi:16S rRNA processing protein RimM
MIRKETLFRIGQFARPHGIKGELSLVAAEDVFDGIGEPCLICEMDGIPVPFYVESYRPKGHSAILVKLERVNDKTAAGRFANKTVYALPSAWKQRPEEKTAWNRFDGYVLEDEKQGWSGTITAVDESTINTLFRVDCQGKELLVPVADELVRSIDHPGRRITVSLPEGITDL